jgi:hypothetical protein
MTQRMETKSYARTVFCQTYSCANSHRIKHTGIFQVFNVNVIVYADFDDLYHTLGLE